MKSSFLVLVILSLLGSVVFAKETAPDGITADMTVREAGAKASKMSSKEIGASIEYLRSKSVKAGAVEKAHIEALIKKLERRKRSREGEEKAQADLEKTRGMMGTTEGDEDAMKTSPPAPTPKAAAKVKAEEDDAYLYNVTPASLRPGNAEMNARVMTAEQLKKMIAVLEEKKAKMDNSMGNADRMFDPAIAVYKKWLKGRSK